MTLHSIDGGGENQRAELRALVDDVVDPIVEAMRDVIARGEYKQLGQHAEDLREAAEAIRDSARDAG